MASQPIKTDSLSAYTQPIHDKSWALEQIEQFGIPGLRAVNAIPPTDTQEYRAFQLALGLKPYESISLYRPKK